MERDAVVTAGPSNSPPPQFSPPIALNKRTSSRNALRETFQDAQSNGSPPTTPPQNRRRTRVKEKGKQPLRAHTNEYDYNSNRHSHGLSWHSTTRDSVVDNLLFSLDNLSKPNLNDDEDNAILDAEFDRAKYRFQFAPPFPIPATKMTQRERSHTHSSSLSSGLDRNLMSESPTTYSPPTPKGRRSNSSSNFGLHATISARMKPSRSSMIRTSSDVQKPITNGVHTSTIPPNKESIEKPNKDIKEYGDGLSTSRPLWGRRSLSMDQIYADAVASGNSMMDRGRPVPSVHHRFESDDVAPEPMIPAGPRKKDNPTATGPVYINQPQGKGTIRKITTQTDLRSVNKPMPSPPIPQNVRNQASDFVRASSIRGNPPIPSAHDSVKAQFTTTVQGPNQKSNQGTFRERPGFFKRVFGGGSSRSNSIVPDRVNSIDEKDASSAAARTSSSNASQSRTGTRQSSRDQPTGQTYPPPALNKKPSSFFRRRKKSTSEEVPVPPLPLGINNSLKVNPTEPSPSISSLRKVMDPFLTEDDPNSKSLMPPTAKPDSFSRPITQDSSTEDSDNLDIFHSGYTPPVGASLGNRDPLSRRPSLMKPKNSTEAGVSEKAKLKVKKRKPEALSPSNPQLLSSRGQDSVIESAKVSPITAEIPLNNKENERPVSRASTGDRIIAQSREIKSDEQERKPSVVSNMSSDRAEDSWVRPSIQELRPDSKKSERLFLKPTASEEALPYDSKDLPNVIRTSRDTSLIGALVSPPFHTATSGTFPSELHSPLSPATQYHSATSLPLPSVQIDGNELRRPLEATELKTVPPAADEGAEYRERARKIFDGDEEDVTKADAASWLGEANVLSTRTLQAFMRLFDFTSVNILNALRTLCSKLVLKGETQQFDRIIMAFSTRWVECNPAHGFKAQDVVHTICYSLILLNTDLHLADIGEKMSRSAYVKNTLPTIRRVVADAAPNAFDETVKPIPNNSRPTLPWTESDKSTPALSPNERTSFDLERPNLAKRLSIRPPFDRNLSDGHTPDSTGGAVSSNALVSYPYFGPMRSWELEIEAILKSFFAAIRTEPLPLLGAPAEPSTNERSTSNANLGGLKRSNSVLSKAQSEATSFRGLKNMTMGFQSKYNRSKPKLYSSSTMGSSKTSFDGDSIWSPVHSSNMSKHSFSKTLTSASMQSLGQHLSPSVGDFKHSIGFANALSQAIIREENAFGQPFGDNESLSISVPGGLLEDESLALEGAPWAKEGLVKHKHHLDSQGRKAKERNWTDVFAVISKGKLTLFAFNTSSKSMSIGRKGHTKLQSNGRASTANSQKVGGGDWMENAEQLDVFVLRQTIASTLPPPGYSKTRPHVWALSLPTGAVHLFQVGTLEIAQEFMSTANYWSARLSKEPLSGGVSNIEYGWSDRVINTALLDSRSGAISPPPPSIQNRPSHVHTNSNGGISRPSLQSSIRTSMDTGFGSRPKLPGDKVHLAEWHPPTQSMMASQLMEVDQLKGLTAYVSNVESELAKHNELKQGIELAYTPRHANYNRAVTNWQRKSDYLLREIVKFQTYVDSLSIAQKAKDDYYLRKSQYEAGKAGAIAEI